MAGPSDMYKAIQIHPSRLCNLNCLHCYSSSSPKERGFLDADILGNTLSEAVDEGYNYLSISGGEPLLYPSLIELLDQGKSLGFKTAVTSNGMLFSAEILDKLSSVTDLIAISLDGIPESHNTMRNHPKAFEKMAKGLELLRNSHIPFGFIFTLTQYNLHELPWIIEFAIQQGAQLLQIHPLENYGSAQNHLVDEQPDRTEAAYAYMYTSQLIQQYTDKLTIQLDYATRAIIKDHPEKVYALPARPEKNSPFASLLGELTIEPDGTVVPIQYGFSRRFALGNIHEMSFKAMVSQWYIEKSHDFYHLCQQVYQTAIKDDSPFVFNWNEAITSASQQQTIDQPLYFKQQ